MLFNYTLLFNVLLIIIITIIETAFFLHFNDMFNIIGLQNYRYVHVHDDFPFHFYIILCITKHLLTFL